MNFGLLLPAGLAALFALLLPLVLHLTRRTEQQTAMFAALRWLQVLQRPRQRIRLEEWLLLVLRLLLVELLLLHPLPLVQVAMLLVVFVAFQTC